MGSFHCANTTIVVKNFARFANAAAGSVDVNNGGWRRGPANFIIYSCSAGSPARQGAHHMRSASIQEQRFADQH